MTDAAIHPFKATCPPPAQFTFPHCYTPHPLVLACAEEVKDYLRLHEEWAEEIAQGKMLGVLVCRPEGTVPDTLSHTQEEGLVFLAAFSGTLGGRTQHPYFVEPVYDLMDEGSYFKQEEEAISHLARSEKSPEREEAKQRSVTLQRWLFAQYRFLNARGEASGMERLFEGTLPPSGTGDCCAPKLLQAAYRRGLHPLCMGEFWMGQSPKGEIRQEGRFYPACSAKCKPLLRHMLQGLRVEPNPLLATLTALPEILYEDEDLLVLCKPAGMLAVPGKDALPNVQDWVRERYPQAEGPLIVHRLDMDTSGLMVVSLHTAAYHHLQQQFVTHQVQKRYTAYLEHALPLHAEGRIDLPLCPDITDRPRQMVHEQYGKRAITIYKVVGQCEGHAIVHLWPHTGRTHQLRVHMAHPRGLGNPIVGDRLYGLPDKRLYLHAEELSFTHPSTGEAMHFVAPLSDT